MKCDLLRLVLAGICAMTSPVLAQQTGGVDRLYVLECGHGIAPNQGFFAAGYNEGKPFDLAELFARLRAIIRRSANKTTNVIEIGEIKIDTALRNVSLKEKPVELTAREYALVEFLALHRGEGVTRTQLYEHLLDENESSLSNLLDVHVSNVRKKLGAEFIVTRRGHGYCIE